MSLDMAVYENEKYVGNGIRESGLRREDIFVTTKYDGGDISSALSTSLRKVSSKYIYSLSRGITYGRNETASSFASCM